MLSPVGVSEEAEPVGQLSCTAGGEQLGSFIEKFHRKGTLYPPYDPVTPAHTEEERRCTAMRRFAYECSY